MAIPHLAIVRVWHGSKAMLHSEWLSIDRKGVAQVYGDKLVQ